MASQSEEELFFYAYRWDGGLLTREAWTGAYEQRRARASRRERRREARKDSGRGRRAAERVDVFRYVNYRRYMVEANGFRVALYLRPSETPNHHHYRALAREIGRRSFADAVRSAPRAPSRSA